MQPVGCLGLSIMAASGFFVLAALGDIVSGGDGRTSMGVLLGLLAFFSLTAYAGYRLYRNQARSAPTLSPEQRVLALANRLQGRITLAEVVLHCRLSTPQARALLRELVRQRLAEVHVSDGGEEVYVFGGFVPEEKDSARDPLD